DGAPLGGDVRGSPLVFTIGRSASDWAAMKAKLSRLVLVAVSLGLPLLADDAAPDRTTVLAVRDDAIKNHKTDLSAKPVDNSVKGTIMISGADGDVPLSGVKVYAVPMDALNMLSTPVTRIRL